MLRAIFNSVQISGDTLMSKHTHTHTHTPTAVHTKQTHPRSLMSKHTHTPKAVHTKETHPRSHMYRVAKTHRIPYLYSATNYLYPPLVTNSSIYMPQTISIHHYPPILSFTCHKLSLSTISHELYHIHATKLSLFTIIHELYHIHQTHVPYDMSKHRFQYETSMSKSHMKY